MAEVNREKLKEYFKSGATPTGAQFAEFIGSVLNFADDLPIQLYPKKKGETILKLYNEKPASASAEPFWSFFISETGELILKNKKVQDMLSITQDGDITIYGDLKIHEKKKIVTNTISTHNQSILEVMSNLRTDKLYSNELHPQSGDGVHIKKLYADNISAGCVHADIMATYFEFDFFNLIWLVWLIILSANSKKGFEALEIPLNAGDISGFPKVLKNNKIDIEKIINIVTQFASNNLKNMDLSKTIGLLASAKNVNFKEMLKNWKAEDLVQQIGYLASNQTSVEIIREKTETFQTDSLYPIAMICQFQPIVICAKYTKEKNFEIYPASYQDGDKASGVKLYWIHEEETDEHVLKLELFPEGTMTMMLYCLMNTEITHESQPNQ